MTDLPRDVAVWITALGLSHPIRSLQWDLANGYLVAEILSKYFRKQFPLYKYSKKVNVDSRQSNWILLEKFAKKYNLRLPVRLVEGTANRRPDAAAMLLIHLYEALTGKAHLSADIINNHLLMDVNYQRSLEPHQRCTIKTAINRNYAYPDTKIHFTFLREKDKIRQVINVYKEEKHLCMALNRKYFGHKLTIREKSIRKEQRPDIAKTFASSAASKDLTSGISLSYIGATLSKLSSAYYDSSSVKPSSEIIPMRKPDL